MTRHRLKCFVYAAMAAMIILGVTRAGRPAFADSTSSYWFRIMVPDNLVPAQIGRAVFRLRSDEIMVFSAALPVRQSALRQITGLEAASVTHLPGATVLRIPLPSGQTVDLAAGGSSFHVIFGTGKNLVSITPDFNRGRLEFSDTSTGPIIAIADRRRDQPLLVGTVKNDAALDRRLRGPGYETIPASQGLVVAAESDELALNPTSVGFSLAAMTPAFPIPVGNPPVLAPRSVAPRRPGALDLPIATIIELRRRMAADRRRIAAAPPLDRRGASLHLARVMLALDLGPEARGVLTDLVRTDPASLEDKQRLALLAASDVLADRPAEAMAEWPHQNGNPYDSDLWIGLAAAEAGDTGKAAPLIGRSVIPLGALPALVRAQVAPIAAETLIAAKQLQPAQALLGELPHAGYLALARAEFEEAGNQDKIALASYRALFDDRNLRTAGIARTRAIMLRYHERRIGARIALARLSRHVYDWRGVRHEVNVRLAIARLRAKTGAWPQAMAGLNRARQLFPDQDRQIDAVRHALFDEMNASGALARMKPLAAVAVIQNNTDLIPAGPKGAAVLQLLSKSLLALDLPDQAASIMRRLVAQAPDAESRARLGLSLARIDLEAGHAKQAKAALDATMAKGLSSRLLASRATAAGEIGARLDSAMALASLTVPEDSKTLAVAALKAAKHHDWPVAQTAWRRVAGLKVPPRGPLDSEQAHIVIQWAAAAVQAKDEPAVALLRTRYKSRLPAGREAALFDTITGAPLERRQTLAKALDQIAAIERMGKFVAPAARAAQ